MVEIQTFPDQLHDLSWSFPGLNIWFLETSWKELSFAVRILIRSQFGASWRFCGRRRILTSSSRWSKWQLSWPVPRTFLEFSWSENLVSGKFMERALIFCANLDQASPELVARAINVQKNLRSLTLPWRVLNFFSFDPPSTFEAFYVPLILMELIRIFFESQEKIPNFPINLHRGS